MALTQDSTTLICLFHHQTEAEAALRDLQQAGIPADRLSVYGAEDVGGNAAAEGFGALEIPARDREHLEQGMRDGGAVITVHAHGDHVATVERIFNQHRAEQIDEVDEGDPIVDEGSRNVGMPLAATAAAGLAGVAHPSDNVGSFGDDAAIAGQQTIPLVEEELAVGKRTVDRGGVRVFKRVIEIPAEESVRLREEHVVVERHAVNRPANEADFAARPETVELIETAEVPVIAKTAHVVEEVVVGKRAEERTEHIKDTVRKTEVEVENLSAEDRNRNRTI